MKFTREQIETEIQALEYQAPASVYYLKRELKRRKASEYNRGRPSAFSDEKHVRNREAAARYRAK